MIQFTEIFEKFRSKFNTKEMKMKILKLCDTKIWHGYINVKLKLD